MNINIIKKLLAVGVFALIACLSAFAQSDPTPTMRWLPLINGYNLAITTNAGPLSLLSTNVEYTDIRGRIVFSYSNTGGTNGLNDAFVSVPLQNDNNGVAQANATLVIAYGNTNLCPITNTSGFVTNWALADPTIGSYQNGTANVYPVNNSNSTNFVTVKLVRNFWNNPRGENVTYPSYRLFETDAQSTFTVTFTQSASGGLIVTNIPASFMQGARNVAASVSCVNGAANGSATLVNFLGISQPQQ